MNENRSVRHYKKILLSKIQEAIRRYPELILFSGFILANLFIDTYRLYLLLVSVYYLIVLLVIPNVAKATWITLISLLLLFKTKNFTFDFGDSEYYLSVLDEIPNITFFVGFYDAWLVLLMYIVLIRDRADFAISYFRKKIDLILLLLLLVGSFASMYSFYPEVSWFWQFQFLKYVIIFYLARMIASTDQKIISQTIKMFLLFTTFNAILVLIQKIQGGPLGLVVENLFTTYGKYADETTGLYRPGGLYWDPNLTASFFSMATPTLLFFSITKNTKLVKFVSFAALLVTVMALFYTASRAAWFVTAAVSIFVYLYVKNKSLLDVKIFLQKRFALIIGLVLALALPVLFNRVSSLGSTFDDRGGLSYRVSHLRMSVEMMVATPFGVGMNMFQYELLRRYDPYAYFHDSTPPHNFLAEIGSSMGILGLILILVFIYFSWQRIFTISRTITRKTKTEHYGKFVLGFSILAYILCAQFYPWLFSSVITSVIWIFLGFSYANISKTSS